MASLKPWQNKAGGWLNQFLTKPGFKEFVFGFIVLVVLLGTIIPVFFPMVEMLSEVWENLREGHYLFSIVSLSFWGAVIMYFYFTRNIEIDSKKFLVIISILVGLTMGLRFWFAFSFEQAFFSDFEEYWKLASGMANNGIEPVDNAFITRALAFNYPLVKLFGDSDAVFKVANVLLLTLSGLIATFLTSKWISNRAAVAVFALVIAFPETYYASLIPSHDISGSFYLMLCFLIFFLGVEKLYHRQFRAGFIYAFLLSLILVLLEMQRGLLLIFMFSSGIVLIFYGLLNTNNKKQLYENIKIIFIPLIIMTVLPFILYSIYSNQLQGRFTLSTEVHSFYHNKIRLNTFHDGSFGSVINDFRSTYPDEIDDLSCRMRFYQSLNISDTYYNPGERIRNFLIRSFRLYSLSSEMNFYLGRLKGYDEEQTNLILKTSSLINQNFYAGLLLFLIILTFKFLFGFRKFNFLVLTFLFFISMLAILLSTIGANQPRYLFMGYFLWPVALSFVLSNLYNSKEKPIKRTFDSNIRFTRYSALSFLVFVIVLFTSYFLFAVSFKNSSLRMLDLDKFEITCTSAGTDINLCTDGLILFPHSTSDRKWSLLRMRLPTSHPDSGHFIKASKTIEVNSDEPWAFEIFVQQPYVHPEERVGFFDIVIEANNVSQVFNLEANDKVHYVRLYKVVPIDRKINISMSITCVNCSPDPSWQRASTTDFRFASLYLMSSVNLSSKIE